MADDSKKPKKETAPALLEPDPLDPDERIIEKIFTATFADGSSISDLGAFDRFKKGREQKSRRGY